MLWQRGWAARYSVDRHPKEEDMPLGISDVLQVLGALLRLIGFLVVGFALGHLVFEYFKAGPWQLQVALILGLFGLLIGITAFSAAGGAGAFALGVGIAYFLVRMPTQKTTHDIEHT